LCYGANSKGNSVDIIDLKTNAVVGKLNPIGAEPSSVAVDTTTRQKNQNEICASTSKLSSIKKEL